jgi:dihydrolipoamide dehydrogenase
MVMGSMKTGTEVLVIGAGPGGYVAAHRAAQLGKEVTLVEVDENLGGTCLNRGCIPSKALISAASLLHEIRHAGDRGIVLSGEVSLDGEKLQAWKRSIVARIGKGVASLMKGAQVEVVRGRARFTGPGEVEVERPEGGLGVFTFQHCIIATGTVPVQLPFLPYDGERVLDSAGALELSEPPRRFVVVGGGYIGVELGIAFRKFGSEVTIVEALERVVPIADPDLTQVLMRKLRRIGIEVLTGARAKGLTAQGLEVEAGGEVRTLPADKILVAVGRSVDTAALNLAAAGVAKDDKGIIRVDSQGRTNVPQIFAVGDAAGGSLAHEASHMGIVAAEAIAGLPSHKDWVSVPAIIFTDPEMAWVGLSEAEAKEQGHAVQVGKYHFVASGRALTLGETDGLCKIVADAQTGLLLGVHLVGPEVTELIAGAAHALEMGATAEDLARTIHPHPTLSEALMEAAMAIYRGKAAH